VPPYGAPCGPSGCARSSWPSSRLSQSAARAARTTRRPRRAGPPARVYWPTQAWRTDDPAELAEVDRLATEAIESLDATVGDLLALHLPPAADPRMASVTLRQLLSMTSGLAGDDGSVGEDDRLIDALFDSPDWVQHILGRPLVAEPGTDWAYSSATSHLLSAIVADSTGQSTLQFARTGRSDRSASGPTTRSSPCSAR
jgi:hypothetical protein